MIPTIVPLFSQFKFKWESPYTFLPGGTSSYVGLNFSKVGWFATFFVYSLVAYRPFCVCCCCCKCCCKCWNYFGFAMVSIQFSHTSPSKCRCSSPSGNLMSCSFLTPWLYSLNYPSYGDVICRISCLYSLDCFFFGDVICGIAIICLTAHTIVSTTLTIVGNTNSLTLPLIIFCTFKYVLSCSLFTHELEAPSSLTLLFFLKALIGESVVAFFIFSNVVCISSLVLLTLASGLRGLSFWCINKY